MFKVVFPKPYFHIEQRSVARSHLAYRNQNVSTFFKTPSDRSCRFIHTFFTNYRPFLLLETMKQTVYTAAEHKEYTYCFCLRHIRSLSQSVEMGGLGVVRAGVMVLM